MSALRPPLAHAVGLALAVSLLLVRTPRATGGEDPASAAVTRTVQVSVRSLADGRPLEGAKVAVAVLGAPVWDAPRSFVTDAGGVAEVRTPRWGGPVRVTARAEGHLPLERELGAENEITLALAPLARLHHAWLQLVNEAGERLAPLVLPEDARVAVRAYGTAPGGTGYASWSVPARDAIRDGLDLPAGAVELTVRQIGWTPAWTRVRVPDDLPIALRLPDRVLRPLTGTVFDVASEAPLPDAVVRYTGWGEGEAHTDETGRFALPALSGDDLPEELRLDWELDGWLRARWFAPVMGEGDAGTEWVLGMHRTTARSIRVENEDGVPVAGGFAWTLGGPWPVPRWPVGEDGTVEIRLPADDVGEVIRYAWASEDGFGWLGLDEVRVRDVVELRPWRRVRARVAAPGEPGPGSLVAGLHLLAADVDALVPTELDPWLWTAPIATDGTLDTVVPAGGEAVLQVDVGRRTAFFRTAAVRAVEAPVLRLGGETIGDRRTLLVLGEDGTPAAGASLRLYWRAPEVEPRPLDLVYEGTADAEGRFAHYGPPGLYDVFLLDGDASTTIGSEVAYGAGEVLILRVAGGE